MITSILLSVSGSAGTNSPSGYLVGIIISLLILGYLIFSLVKPEKF
ncbi:MAG: potassium-transporting ATPase subunit F [Bacteroidales bacterium]|nr:potassium-transporting ATPase subunit F [Bacteroidales bacterium]MBK9358176.1 potassium-transporting ATPase subunit F [Bacteroidales bacterium]